MGKTVVGMHWYLRYKEIPLHPLACTHTHTATHNAPKSMETICLLLAYKIKYPENFFILRGNHECASINRIYGTETHTSFHAHTNTHTKHMQLRSCCLHIQTTHEHARTRDRARARAAAHTQANAQHMHTDARARTHTHTSKFAGFYDECKRRYNIKLWKTFIDCFNW